jgi:hypothetical protein
MHRPRGGGADPYSSGLNNPLRPQGRHAAGTLIFLDLRAPRPTTSFTPVPACSTLDLP